MAKPTNKTPGFNVYLGTKDEKDHALAKLGEVAKALEMESVGQLVRWLATQETAVVIELLRPLRAKEFDEKASKFK